MENQKYEYSDIIVKDGERIDIAQLNDAGEAGWKLAAVREFAHRAPGVPSFTPQGQLIFMRKIPTEQFPS